MNGLEIKARITLSGLRVWDVSRDTGIHYARLSMILNNRIEATPGEIEKINETLKKAEEAIK
ncbi:MAG: hypothetical protein WCX65_15665 [bacterium]